MATCYDGYFNIARFDYSYFDYICPSVSGIPTSITVTTRQAYASTVLSRKVYDSTVIVKE